MSPRKKNKDQQWFNNKYSRAVIIDISGNKRLNFSGALKIRSFERLRNVSLKKLKLTKLEISNCPEFSDIHLSELAELTNLEISDCNKLDKLNLSKLSKLESIDVSNLVELDCSNTSIEMLSLNLCPDIKKLVCSNNNKLINLDISNCSKLEYLDCSGTNLKTLDLSHCNESMKLIKPSGLKPIGLKKTRNIIIVGRTGSGKSTLSNVLTGTDVFKESDRSTSETKIFHKRDFVWNEETYRAVDTVGLRDTKLTEKQVLYKVVDGIYSIPEGITQVLFVIDGRFTDDEVKTFNTLKDSIFKNDVLRYITIVRTKFSNFKNELKCNEDKKTLHSENDLVAKIVRKCRDIIYVDNPPIDYKNPDEDDERIIEINKRTREKSRTKLLDHLDGISKEDEYFKIDKWHELHPKIIKYVDENIPLSDDMELDLDFLIKMSKAFCSIM